MRVSHAVKTSLIFHPSYTCVPLPWFWRFIIRSDSIYSPQGAEKVCLSECTSEPVSRNVICEHMWVRPHPRWLGEQEKFQKAYHIWVGKKREFQKQNPWGQEKEGSFSNCTHRGWIRERVPATMPYMVEKKNSFGNHMLHLGGRSVSLTMSYTSGKRGEF